MQLRNEWQQLLLDGAEPFIRLYILVATQQSSANEDGVLPVLACAVSNYEGSSTALPDLTESSDVRDFVFSRELD